MDTTAAQNSTRRLITSLDSDFPERYQQINDILLQLQAEYEDLLKLEYEKSNVIVTRENSKIQEICQRQEVTMKSLEQTESEKDCLFASWNCRGKSISEVLQILNVSEKEEAAIMQHVFYLKTLITDLEGRSRTNAIMLADTAKMVQLSFEGMTGRSTITYNGKGVKQTSQARQLVDLTA
ncbi:MAG: flagellar export chaperone FlgN [Leptospiraceae bacterium]|nr:flagellar export chaperone FlgN [Leptospiraceae bacterium]